MGGYARTRLWEAEPCDMCICSSLGKVHSPPHRAVCSGVLTPLAWLQAKLRQQGEQAERQRAEGQEERDRLSQHLATALSSVKELEDSLQASRYAPPPWNSPLP